MIDRKNAKIRLKNTVFSGVTVTALLVTSVFGVTPISAQVTIEDRVARVMGTPGEDYAEGQVIVTLAAAPEADNELLDEGVIKSYGMRVEDVMDFGDAADIAETQEEEREFADENLYISVVSSDEYSTEELIEKLEGEEDVISVEPNYRMKKMTNDTLFDEQWAIGGTAYSSAGGSVGVNYTDEQENPGYTSASTVVAVVDDGIYYDHEDLAGNMWSNPFSATKLEGKHGYDFVNGDADPMPDYAEDSHGTHVAGIISGVTGNSEGVAGMSYAQLMACKVFDEKNSNSGLDSVILQAYEYIYKAQELGVNISAVNCSFGAEASQTYSDSASNRSAINTVVKKIGSMGALMVFAAGNESTDTTKYNKGFPYYLDRDYVLLVGSSNVYDEMSAFSNYSKTEVDLLAPGSQILSTYRNDTFLPESYSQEKRNRLCLLYQDFDSGIPNIYTYKDFNSRSSTALTVSSSTKDFYGNSSNGSLSIKISYLRTISTTAGTFFLDVTDLGLDVGSNTYYISYEIALDDDADGDWMHVTSKLSRSSLYSISGRTYIRFPLTTMLGATISKLAGHEIYFDNFAISVPNPDTTEFGKYEYESGTSMAAPYVSGAVARLATMYPTADAGALRKMICKSIRTNSSVADKTITGGILDISRFADEDVAALAPVKTTVKVTKVKLNKTSATLRAGKKLTLKATISPSNAANKKVKWTVSNSKYASVTQKGVVKAKKKGIGHTVKVTATAKDGSKKKATCKIRIKK